MNTKFIVVELNGKEQIFTFPASVDHDRMLDAIGAIQTGPQHLWRRDYRGAKLVAAGFVEDGECRGESVTLKIGSRGAADTLLLSKTAPAASSGEADSPVADYGVALPQPAAYRYSVSGMWEYSTSRDVAVSERKEYEEFMSDDPDTEHEEPEELYTAEQLRSVVEADRRARRGPLANPVARPDGGELALNAARWTAFVGSARIRPLGCAGLIEPEPGFYAHVGFEIWTAYAPSSTPELQERLDSATTTGREWLTKYADIAVNARKARAHGEPTQNIEEVLANG